MTKKRLLSEGEWVIVGGLLFFLGILLVALFSDSFRSSPAEVHRASVAPDADTPPPAVETPAAAETQGGRGAAAATEPNTAPTTSANAVIALAQLPQVHFQGTIQQVTEQLQHDGQLLLWIQVSEGRWRQVAVAPDPQPVKPPPVRLVEEAALSAVPALTSPGPRP